MEEVSASLTIRPKQYLSRLYTKRNLGRLLVTATVPLVVISRAGLLNKLNKLNKPTKPLNNAQIVVGVLVPPLQTFIVQSKDFLLRTLTVPPMLSRVLPFLLIRYTLISHIKLTMELTSKNIISTVKS